MWSRARVQDRRSLLLLLLLLLRKDEEKIVFEQTRFYRQTALVVAVSASDLKSVCDDLCQHLLLRRASPPFYL